MTDAEFNFEDKAYWDKKAREFPPLGVGLETFEETKAVWEYFKYCLQTQNRFFFDHPLIPLIKKHFHEHAFILKKGTEIYRARIDETHEYAEQCWIARDYIEFQKTDKNSPYADYYKAQAESIADNPKYKKFLERQAQGFEGFNAEASGVPPCDKATAGRCNPEHVAFLYTSSDKHTAAAEVRPYIKDAISIAPFWANRDLKLLDFYYEYDKYGIRDIDNIFFDKMRTEFSLLNKGNKEEYLTTQYLSLLAQNERFDGIRFKSSLVEQGENYVIFNADNCTARSSKVYVLRKVEYDLFSILPEEEKETAND